MLRKPGVAVALMLAVAAMAPVSALEFRGKKNTFYWTMPEKMNAAELVTEK